MSAPATIDGILDGIVGKLGVLYPGAGHETTAEKYLRQLARYMGEKIDPEVAPNQGGVAGRCPSMLVAFMGEKPLRRSVGGRTQLVEGSFAVICCSDSQRAMNDRKSVFALLEDARRLVGGRSLGLSMSRLKPEAQLAVCEDPRLTAYAQRFSTQYWVDLTVDNDPPRIGEYSGTIPLSGRPAFGLGPDYSAAVLEDAPLVYLRLNDPLNAAFLADGSAHGHYAEVFNGDLELQYQQPGLIAGADKAVAAANSFSAFFTVDGLSVTTTFSLVWWVKPTGLGEDDNAWKLFNATNPSPMPFVCRQVGSGGALECGWGDAKFTAADLPAGTMQLGERAMLAFTWDGVSAQVYKNGALLAGPRAMGAHELFTQLFWNAINRWTGVLDEVSLHPTALSAERLALYWERGNVVPAVIPYAVGVHKTLSEEP